ncbi:MAG: hypothetical protein ACE367_05235 [Acidimicrobiales bacterium]
MLVEPVAPILETRAMTVRVTWEADGALLRHMFEDEIEVAGGTVRWESELMERRSVDTFGELVAVAFVADLSARATIAVASAVVRKIRQRGGNISEPEIEDNWRQQGGYL